MSKIRTNKFAPTISNKPISRNAINTYLICLRLWVITVVSSQYGVCLAAEGDERCSLVKGFVQVQLKPLSLSFFNLKLLEFASN